MLACVSGAHFFACVSGAHFFVPTVTFKPFKLES